MSKIVSVLFVLMVSVLCVSAEENSFANVFKRAKKYYTAGGYDSTIAILRDYLKEHGKEKSTEYIVPLLMEALLRQNNFAYFKKLLNIYRRKFPDSQFIPRLLYLDGIVKAKEEDYQKAILSFSESLKSGVYGALDSLAVLNVEMICESGTAVRELSRLLRRFDLHPKVEEIVKYYELKKFYDSGQVAKAKKLAEEFKKKYPKSSYRSNAKRIISKSRSIRKRTTLIGLLAPVSGENADIGRFVVQGVQLAVDRFNKKYNTKIELVICDTRGDMVETALKTKEMVFVHKVSVIIGPVLSPNATVAASILMDHSEVMMITPTATDDGIARLSENVFQMNVTLSILGKKIARYAFENLKIKEFAILVPITEYGRILSSNFKEEVKRLGGEIIAEEHFDEGTNDFRLQFESLRSKLAERRWEQMAIEGEPEYGKSARGRRAKESYLADSTIEIGGLFIPAESEDVIKLTSQVYFHRIQTQLLGSNGWHTNATILGGKRYVNNAIFSTNFEIDAQNKKWIAFSKLFWKRFNENPDHIAAPLGYDAANLVLNAMKDEDDAESIVDQLKTVKNYHGVSGTVSFNNDEGVNSEAAILKISNKKFIRIQ